MKRNSARAALVIGLLPAAASISSCSSPPKSEPGTAAARLDNPITVAGSTAVPPLINAAASAFQTEHVAFGGLRPGAIAT